MKKILFIVLFICFFIQSCGQWVSLTPNYINTSCNYIKNYEKGKQNTVFTGQAIIKITANNEQYPERIINFIAPKYLYITAKYKITDYNLKIIANKEYPPKASININGIMYYLINVNDSNNLKWGVLVSGNGVINDHAIYSYYHQMLYYPSSMTLNPSNLEFLVQKKSESIVPLSHELIFAGKNDVSLNIAYREYTANDLARPAFFQNITYQANAKQIRFKDYLMQIHNVTNEQITVIEDGLF